MINIDPSLIVTVAILFFILLAVVNSKLVKPIVAHIDNRNKSIKDGLANANENQEEIAKLKQEALDIVSQAKAKASEVRAEQLGAAKEALAKRVEAKKAEIEAELEGFYVKLNNEKEELRSSLLSQAPLFKESLKAKLISN